MVSQYYIQPQQPQGNQTNNNIKNYTTTTTKTNTNTKINTINNNNNNTINNNSNNNNNNNMQSNPSIQQKRPGLPNPIISSERCCTFRITSEERRHRDLETEQSRILKDIMLKTNTKIEVTATKDGALNFCIIGKENSLRAAKNLVLNDFQTSVTLTVSVPKSIHGRLLGQKGQRLLTIQDETQTKISIPRKEEDSDIIKIVGLKSNAEMAVRSIQAAAREFAAKAIEKVTVERIYLLFITGPFNDNLKRWEEMGAKVSTSAGLMLGNSEREPEDVTFTILGETTVVGQVKEEIQQIYEDKKKKCTTVNIEVKKAQHKYILGPNGQNLRNLFAKTGVSVELPQESESETITLRGERSKLGPALSELYTQAHSETDDVLEVESWLHKYLIGGRRTNMIDFKARGVDVKSYDNKIKLHGPPTEVENVKDMLEAEHVSLKNSLIRKDIRVEPRIHGYIIGRAGATVDQIREESGAHVLVPKNDEPNEFITLEGTSEAVAIAEVKIDAIAKKYEASRKLVIDQQLHGSIIGRGGEKIRSIREKFSNIIFTFPEQGSKNNDITILGPADEVEECYKYLDEFHKQLQESNHKLQVPIKKEIVKYIADAQGAIKRIKIDSKVKIDIFLSNNTEAKKGQSGKAQAAQAQTGEVVANNNESNETADAKKKGSKSKGQKKPAQKSEQPTQQQPQQVPKSPPKTNDKAIASNEDNYALITGKKEDVDQAKVKLLKLFDELTTTSEFEVKISHKVRSQLGPKTKAYKMFLEEFQQKVVISFAPGRQQEKQLNNAKQTQTGGEDNTNSTTETNGTSGKDASKGTSNKMEIVKIRGPKNIAKKAEKRFEALVAETQERIEKNFSASVSIETSVIEKFQYADKIKIGKIREAHNVKLVIPDSRESPKLHCSVTGYEKNVQTAIQQFVELCKDVEERTKEVIEIPSQVHPRLIGAQGIVVKRIIDEFKVEVKFARQGDPNPDAVVLIGRPQNIKAAKDHMNKLADQYLTSASRANSNHANSDNNNNSQQLTSEVTSP